MSILLSNHAVCQPDGGICYLKILKVRRFGVFSAPHQGGYPRLDRTRTCSPRSRKPKGIYRNGRKGRHGQRGLTAESAEGSGDPVIGKPGTKRFTAKAQRSPRTERHYNKNGSPVRLPFSLTKRAFLTSIIGGFAIWFVRLTATPLAHDDSLTRGEFAPRGVYWTFTLAVKR